MNPIARKFMEKASEVDKAQLPLPFLVDVFEGRLALPRVFAQSAAFSHSRTAIQKSGLVPALEGVSVRLSGLQLNQTHLSLFLVGVTLASAGGTTEVVCGKRALCRAAGMSQGGSRTKALEGLLEDLQYAALEAEWQGGRKFRGVLLTSFWIEAESIRFRINPDVLSILDGATYVGNTLFLGLSPVSKQLCAYAAHQKKLHTIGAGKWMPIFGFSGARKEAFRRMRIAGKELEGLGFLDFFSIDRDGTMHVRRAR